MDTIPVIENHLPGMVKEIIGKEWSLGPQTYFSVINAAEDTKAWNLYLQHFKSGLLVECAVRYFNTYHIQDIPLEIQLKCILYGIRKDLEAGSVNMGSAENE